MSSEQMHHHDSYNLAAASKAVRETYHAKNSNAKSTRAMRKARSRCPTRPASPDARDKISADEDESSEESDSGLIGKSSVQPGAPLLDLAEVADMIFSGQKKFQVCAAFGVL